MDIVIHERRRLSPFQLFEKLQKEYFIGELRSKIYPKANDKTFWKKYIALKQEKIEQIAKRNSLPCIFSNKKLMEEYRARFINPIGLPNFDYKDQEEYNKLYILDIKNYFYKGTEVKINISDTDIVYGKIERFDFNKNQVLVILQNGKEEVFFTEQVTRIL